MSMMDEKINENLRILVNGKYFNDYKFSDNTHIIKTFTYKNNSFDIIISCRDKWNNKTYYHTGAYRFKITCIKGNCTTLIGQHFRKEKTITIGAHCILSNNIKNLLKKVYALIDAYSDKLIDQKTIEKTENEYQKYFKHPVDILTTGGYLDSYGTRGRELREKPIL